MIEEHTANEIEKAIKEMMRIVDKEPKPEPLQEAAKPNRRARRAFGSCIRRKVPLHIARVCVMGAQYR